MDTGLAAAPSSTAEPEDGCHQPGNYCNKLCFLHLPQDTGKSNVCVLQRPVVQYMLLVGLKERY